jgi:hypothetical protein
VDGTRREIRRISSNDVEKPFQLLQRALCNFTIISASSPKFFAVFADTSSRITEFAPRLKRDPSIEQ